MKHRRLPGGDNGKLSGGEYREMVADLLLWHRSETPAGSTETVSSSPRLTAGDAPTDDTSISPAESNVPLRRSPNERIRALVNLPEQGTLDESHMRPAAAQYRRDRPYLTDELCAKWSIFYLPPDAKSTLRGRWAYQIDSVQGEALAFAGRDPEFELKLREWEQQGKPEGKWLYRRSQHTGAPTKTRFPSGEFFRKGLELYGQQASRLDEPRAIESLDRYGLIVTPGFNSVVRLDAADVIAVGTMAAEISREQRVKLLQWAQQLCGGRLTVWDTADGAGQRRSEHALGQLAPYAPVLQACNEETHAGQFVGKAPDELDDEGLQAVLASIEARWQRSKS